MSTTTPWLVQRRPNAAAALRMFCFPYSGADASLFYRWQESLPASVEVCPVQLPGRGARLNEPLISGIQPLVDACGPALLPYLDKPFAFFGHSLGALIAYELARWTRKCIGREPEHLFVSACGAPQLPDRETSMHDLPEPEFVEGLRKLNGTPEAVLADTELRALILPILRADFTVCETYSYVEDKPLNCPISAFGGLQDAHVGRGRLEAWRVQTAAGFLVRMFPGDHFFINSDRALLMRVLAQDLAIAGRRRQP